MKTIEIVIETTDQQLREQIIAALSDLDYDAFEERETELVAFVNEEKFNADALNDVLNQHKINFTSSVINEQNWNALWESNFQPVVVDDFCVIRADFHPPLADVKYDIIITPKMSFGTGHHATTYMMISEMRKINFKHKKVADFGTGTGVLAVLAEKLGSEHVEAIDYDDWSIANSKENIEKNDCSQIEIIQADSFTATGTFDIILANINKNVILNNLSNLVKGLAARGQLLLSGFLLQDESDIVDACTAQQLEHITTLEKNNWICLLFAKGVQL